ncbi:MAG TPA: hypothetical protein VM580_14080 [Labilithrix sp.]|nr:hypothetical protein [Labilithrix sp.]
MLKLDYSIKAFEELYVSDRLWSYDDDGNRICDPFSVYRFVVNDALRLVFMQAPHAPNVAPRVLYTPLYSRVRGAETHQRSIAIELPVDEYSSLARNIAAPTVVQTISRVLLVMGYRLRSTMAGDPSPPVNETADQAGFVVNDPKLIVSTLDVERLPVKRRTDYMARFALPGEPGPGPAPPPQ